MYLPIYLSIYLSIYLYTNLPLNAIVRLPHPWIGCSQGQETFLAPSADKQTRNYDTEKRGKRGRETSQFPPRPPLVKG